MPKEASNHFGESLFPFVTSVASSDQSIPFCEQEAHLPKEIYNAIICSNGELTPNYRYIQELRNINQKEKTQEKLIEENEEGMTETGDGDDLKEIEQRRPFRKIPKNISMVMLNLTGHLFDTKCFNKCIDVCEAQGI
mmetsp:Transcript_14194/g.24131  ORF Transcript_14194/g.24131 Transcript_14194/m.24131 type:complete len:137 (-) Transcript_14194:250-660(-)